MSTKLGCKLLLRGTAGNGDCAVTQLASVLQGQMSEPAESLNRDSRSWHYTLASQAVEDSDTGTEQRAELSSVDIVRDPDTGFAPKYTVFTITTILGHSVDLLVLAHLEETRLARPADA